MLGRQTRPAELLRYRVIISAAVQRGYPILKLTQPLGTLLAHSHHGPALSPERLLVVPLGLTLPRSDKLDCAGSRPENSLSTDGTTIGTQGSRVGLTDRQTDKKTTLPGPAQNRCIRVAGHQAGRHL